MQLTIIAAIFVAIGGVVFAMQNNVPVTVNFLFWRFDSSLAMVLLLAVALGSLVIALLTTPATLRRQWLIARQKKQLDELARTCTQQRQEIDDRQRTPAAAVAAADTEAAPPLPYVGLRQIVSDSSTGVAPAGKPD